MAKRKKSRLTEALLEMAEDMYRGKIMSESAYKKIVKRLSGDSAKTKMTPRRRA